MHASGMGNLTLVKLLIEMGANPDIEQRKPPYTALEGSAINGYQQVFDYLLPLTSSEEVRKGAASVLPEGLGYRTRCKDKVTQALKRSVIFNDLTNLKNLISLGADVNQFSQSGESALHVAADRGNLEAVIILIDAGANLDLVSECGRSALEIAVKEGYPDIIRKLITVNPDAIIGNTNLLVLAAGWNKLESVKVLLEFGVDLNGINRWGETALEAARRCKYVAMTEFLKSLGAIGRDDIEFDELPF
jgi:ankyrin repeat protein